MKFDKAIEKMIKVAEETTAILLGISVCIIVLQITFRYVLKSPLVWSEQTARYIFIWAMALGIPIIFYRKLVMGFDLLLHALSDNLQYIIGLLIKVLTLVFSVFYAKSGIELCIKSWGSWTVGVEIPFLVLYIAMPVSAIMLSLVMIDFIMLDIQGRKNGKNEGGQEK